MRHTKVNGLEYLVYVTIDINRKEVLSMNSSRNMLTSKYSIMFKVL
ncbi:MAG: hypothetical protein QXY40_05265 [Candidatus Methanomethylicia archaeon]